MEEILQHIQEVLNVPEVLINQCTFLPEYIRMSLIASIKFIPWLYFLYYAIELVERFFLKHINIFIRLIQKLGPLFGVAISTIPECGYQVIASTFYSRKMISRGTLLAFFIACSDDALPLLFMDLSKTFAIIPIIIIKIILGIAVAYSVDIIDMMILRKRRIMEDINAINTDLNEPACCHHRIQTIEHPPYWWMHPLTHTFNMFMFTFLSLAVIECAINGFGSAENLASFLMIDTPYQLVVTAIIGLASNCAISVFLAMAYIKGIISFPALLAGLITTTGLGLLTLTKRLDDKKDLSLITFILLTTAILAGLFVYYNIYIFDMIKNYIFG
ncbi:arsenic efflux protein [bacterium]|nr:arsenic efflux protein [bacterium]